MSPSFFSLLPSLKPHSLWIGPFFMKRVYKTMARHISLAHTHKFTHTHLHTLIDIHIHANISIHIHTHTASKMGSQVSETKGSFIRDLRRK